KSYKGASALEVSLDDQAKTAEVKHENNNIPDIIKRWQSLIQDVTAREARQSHKQIPSPEAQKDGEWSNPRTAQSFLVPFNEIKANDWDLSINRYKEIEYEEVQYDPPMDIIAAIRELQKQNQQDLDALEGLLK
ncbi:MAG: hypothetical protein RJQ14_03415, partial [Marinoscillum sp.]